MKKAQNSLSEMNLDISLPREKILRGKRNIQQLFHSSSTLHSTAIIFRYRYIPESTEGIKVGFSAPKKIFRKAVERNKIKRILREAYRLQQSVLSKTIAETDGSLHGMFIAKKEMPFDIAKSEIKSLLNRCRRDLLQGHSKRSGILMSRPQTSDQPRELNNK